MEHLATTTKEDPSIWQALITVLIMLSICNFFYRTIKDFFED